MIKKFIAAGLLGLTLFAGCTSETSYGKCIGINGDKEPNLTYEYDIGNLVGAVVFFELIVPPIYVAVKGVQCPTGRKAIPQATPSPQ